MVGRGEVCAVWCPLARAVGGGAATAGAIGAAAAGVRAGRLDVHSVSGLPRFVEQQHR